jgi:hypothetical protein
MLCFSFLPHGVSMFCLAGTIKMNAYMNRTQYGLCQFYIHFSTIYHTSELILNLDHKVHYTATGHGTP